MGGREQEERWREGGREGGREGEQRRARESKGGMDEAMMLGRQRALVEEGRVGEGNE